MRRSCIGVVATADAQPLGLDDIDAVIERESLDGARLHLHAATRGPVGLRQHESDGVTRHDQRGERRRCELGRPGEDQPHREHLDIVATTAVKRYRGRACACGS